MELINSLLGSSVDCSILVLQLEFRLLAVLLVGYGVSALCSVGSRVFKLFEIDLVQAIIQSSRLELLSVPVFKLVDQLLLGCVYLCLHVLELGFVGFQSAVVVTIVSLHVLEVLQEDELLFIYDVLLRDLILVGVGIEIGWPASILGLPFLLLLLKFGLQLVYLLFGVVYLLGDVFGGNSKLLHVVSVQENRLFHCLPNCFLEFKISGLLVSCWSLLLGC